MTASALRISRSRWFAADPRITDERAKAVLASAFESVPGSVEHLYYTSILLSLPQGIVPGDALIAATDGNSFESRSARARRQRRDRKGQFAYEGGGIRALIRRLNGDIFSISGRVVANAKNSRDVEVEFPDGKIAQVNPVKGEYIKAVLPTPDGYSPKPIVPSASDEVIDEKDLVFLDAPNGWVKDEAFKDFGDKVERYVDSNKEFVVFVSEKDDGTKDYQILNAKSAEEIDVVKTWADVQDRLEGKEDQILNPKARLPKQQAAPVETKSGFEYNYPDNAYKIRQDSEYDVQGRVDEESPDFTDDPVELAQKQDERDLLAALEQAVSPGDDGENALGVGALPFGKGDEFVPAEAIFFALQEAGMDAPMELAKIYDKKLGNNANEKALNDFRKKEEVVSGNAPELAESFKKVTEQNPDLEPPTEEPKFDAKEADSAPLPALLEGLSEKELDQFVETKDHIPYLPKNEEIEMPQGYNPLSPEPFAAWKEVTAENPDAILPEGFSDNPVYLAQEIPTNDLLKELRRSVEPGNEVPGAAVIALPTEDGEDFVANVPGEAVRDALQLQGVDTNAELKKIADEGFVGQREEPVANIPPTGATGKEIYERRIATGDSLDKVAKELGIPREEVRRLEAEYARTLDKAPEKPTGQPEDVAAINVNSPTLQEDIQSAIDKGQKIAFSYDGKNRVVLPKSIWINPKNDNVNLRAVEDGIQKNFTLDKMEMAEGITTPAKSKTNEEPQAEIPLDLPVEKKPMNAYERLMAEQKAEAEAVEERVAKLKKDAEDRVDEQGRSVPEGWGFIAKNRPNFGQVDRPDNYFNVYGNNNFEASIDADGKITVKDRNGLLPDKSYDNWEDLQADLENQKSEYSSLARERVREIAKKYGYSDEQIAAFDSMSQQELANFFANPENHTQAYAEALDDLANSSAIDLPNAAQKQRWAQMRKDEKILAQAGDGLEGAVDNQDIQEPQEIDNIPVEQEKLDDNKVAEDKTYVEENPEVIKVNAFVEANAGRLAPIKARDVKRGDFLWNNFNKVYEEILDIQPAAFARVRFLIKDPRNQKEYFRFFERRSPIRNMRRPGTGEVSEGFKVAPEENRGDGPKRGRALRKPLEERVEAVPGRAVGGFAYREGFYKDKNGIPLKPGDRIRHGNAKKNEMYGEGVVIVRAGDQIDEAKGVGGIGRDGKVYLDYVWVQIPGEAGPRLWKARMIVKQPDNAGPEQDAPAAVADDKFAVPLMEPVVRKDKDKDLEEQIRRAIDAGDEVSFNYNGKTRYVKPVKIWKNPVNDNVNVTAIENGEIKNFTISKMGYIEDPEGAALKRSEAAPAPDANPREAEDGVPNLDKVSEAPVAEPSTPALMEKPEKPEPKQDAPRKIFNGNVFDKNNKQFDISIVKIGDEYEAAAFPQDGEKRGEVIAKARILGDVQAILNRFIEDVVDAEDGNKVLRSYAGVPEPEVQPVLTRDTDVVPELPAKQTFDLKSAKVRAREIKAALLDKEFLAVQNPEGWAEARVKENLEFRKQRLAEHIGPDDTDRRQGARFAADMKGAAAYAKGLGWFEEAKQLEALAGLQKEIPLRKIDAEFDAKVAELEKLFPEMYALNKDVEVKLGWLANEKRQVLRKQFDNAIVYPDPFNPVFRNAVIGAQANIDQLIQIAKGKLPDNEAASIIERLQKVKAGFQAFGDLPKLPLPEIGSDKANQYVAKVAREFEGIGNDAFFDANGSFKLKKGDLVWGDWKFKSNISAGINKLLVLENSITKELIIIKYDNDRHNNKPVFKGNGIKAEEMVAFLYRDLGFASPAAKAINPNSPEIEAGGLGVMEFAGPGFFGLQNIKNNGETYINSLSQIIPEFRAELLNFIVANAIIGNTDRHAHNFMWGLDAAGQARLIPVDNGLAMFNGSFGKADKNEDDPLYLNPIGIIFNENGTGNRHGAIRLAGEHVKEIGIDAAESQIAEFGARMRERAATMKFVDARASAYIDARAEYIIKNARKLAERIEKGR
jgi:predicted DNA-binding transcriptional regulator YafY